MNLTTITANAAQDALSDDDYMDMYTELRQAVSLDRLVMLLSSQYSKATWHKFERGMLPLTRPMRNELRRACRLLLLPPTVAEACATIDENAEVVRIGDSSVRRAILIGTSENITIGVNGAVTLVTENDARKPTVTKVTRATRRLVRPVATPEQNERRAALGTKWSEVIEAGLAAMEGIT